jgi:hypothetical protein
MEAELRPSGSRNVLWVFACLSGLVRVSSAVSLPCPRRPGSRGAAKAPRTESRSRSDAAPPAASERRSSSAVSVAPREPTELTIRNRSRRSATIPLPPNHFDADELEGTTHPHKVPKTPFHETRITANGGGLHANRIREYSFTFAQLCVSGIAVLFEADERGPRQPRRPRGWTAHWVG